MKLTTYFNYYFMFLFCLSLNCVLNVNPFKKQNIETIIKTNKLSDLKVNLNNTNNQISLIFENTKIKIPNENNLADEINLNSNNNTSREQEDSQNFSNENNSLEDQKNSNSLINEEKLEEKIHQKIEDSNNEEKNKNDINDINNSEKIQNDIINKNHNSNSISNLNLNNKIINFDQQQQTQKKIKYFESLKNFKKVKSRLNNYKENLNGNNHLNYNLNSFTNYNKITNNKNYSNSSTNRLDKDSDLNISTSDLNKITEGNIKDEILFEEFLKQKSPTRKKKYIEDDNVFMFYNSLSLIMLSMLGGGVVGVIFILYFSFKHDTSNNISN